MTGILDVGGGTRDIYGAGILDGLLDADVSVDLFLGISAGAANGASFIARQRGRNYPFYSEYVARKQYLGLIPLLKSGGILGLDYIYGELSNEGGENPLDYDAFVKNPTAFYVGVMDAHTGKSVFFDKSCMSRNDYRALMASASLPVVTRPKDFGGVKCIDGGAGEPVPYKKAFELGCDRLLVILTKPLDAILPDKRNALASKILKRRYPEASATLLRATASYAQSVDELLELEKTGKVCVVYPDTVFGMGTLSKDKALLNELYKKGLKDSARAVEFLSK